MLEIHEQPVFDPVTMTFRHVVGYDGPPVLASWASNDRVDDEFLRQLSTVPEHLYHPIPGIKERWDAEVERCRGLSSPVGKPGERIEIELEYVESSFPRATEYGFTVMHTFRSGPNILKWWTGKNLTLAVGEKRTVKATIKEHQGPHTILTRVAPLKGESGFTVELTEDRD